MATASESSSAMLDLNDADSEETDAPGVLEDVRDAVPLIMEHGYDIAVKVDAPMKQLSTLETFVTYRVRCVCARWPAPPLVRRRYNHFKQLHKRLCASHPWLAPPPLPPLHTARQQLDRYSPSFVHIRTMALHAFLERVAKHPIFTHSEDFRIFLTTPDEEIDKVFKSESGAMNLWGLGSALYSTNENKPTNGARVKDPEWTSYAEYLTSLQHKLTTLCTLTTKLHKGTVSLSNEMINMKRTCSSWSAQARGDTGVAAAAVARALPSAPHAAPPRARALLPLLASYTAAHLEKIKQRDQLHAAYVAGANTGDIHNKLEQATECLRSELADWLPKTRSDVTALLLDLARAQLHWHTQIYHAWENALKLSKETNPEEIFKTVSLAGVSLLSPSRARAFQTPGVSETPGASQTEVSQTQPTEELEDLDNYSNSTDCDEILDSKTSQWNGQEIQNHQAENKQDVPKTEGLSIQGVIQSQDKEDFLKEILDEDKIDSNAAGKSSESDVVTDPLRDFSDPLRDSRDFAEVDLRDFD